jgi:hypothetical protein
MPPDIVELLIVTVRGTLLVTEDDESFLSKS